jgi:thiamine-phosphate pyrophosphorylase
MDERPREGRRLIRCRLYLITPPRIELKTFAAELERTLAAGDVASLQLRLKDVGDEVIRDAVRALKPIAQAKDVAFILNDRPDLAAELDCDGVHVGQDDMSYDEARNLIGPNKVVGVTCHNSRHLALEAAEAGADYVAFGAFFPTATKEPKTTAEIETLQWWAEIMEIPCVAIGGITVANAAPLVEAGADFLAVSSGVWDHAAGPAAAVREFNELFARMKR